MKKILKNKKGFTMIELMVVIVIMLILAAIAIPSFNRLITQANETAAIAEARTVLMLAEVEAQQAILIDEETAATIQTSLNTSGEQGLLDKILADAGLDSSSSAVFTVAEDGSISGTFTSSKGIEIILPDLTVKE